MVTYFSFRKYLLDAESHEQTNEAEIIIKGNFINFPACQQDTLRYRSDYAFIGAGKLFVYELIEGIS